MRITITKRMMEKKDLTRNECITFKVFFFVAFSLWAIFVDYWHYKVGEQMLTFYSVNLIMTCFIIFKPWIGKSFPAARIWCCI